MFNRMRRPKYNVSWRLANCMNPIFEICSNHLLLFQNQQEQLEGGCLHAQYNEEPRTTISCTWRRAASSIFATARRYDPKVARIENYVVFWAGDARKPAICAPCHTKEQQEGPRNKRVRIPKKR